MEKLVQHGVVAPLVKNCSDASTDAGLNALQSLVHLSSLGTASNQCILDMLEAGGISRMTEIVLGNTNNNNNTNKDWRKRINFSCALLANMTRTEQGAIDLVGKALPEEAVPKERADDESSTTKQQDYVKKERPTLTLLLERFWNRNYLEMIDYRELEEHENPALLDSHDKDPFQHFAAVLMNLTQVAQGRQFLLRIPLANKDKADDKGDNKVSVSILETLLGQLRSPNPIRRRGIAGTIRNCCLETESAWWFLNVLNLTNIILYPLAGPEALDVDDKIGMDPDLWLEGPDKVRETDMSTRLFLVEAILLLCASGRNSRATIRLARTYVILKEADMVEEEESVSVAIEECVQYLRRDEDGTREGSSDKAVTEYITRNLLLPSTSAQVGAEQDYDDVD
jgi:hypothetical protein